MPKINFDICMNLWGSCENCPDYLDCEVSSANTQTRDEVIYMD